MKCRFCQNELSHEFIDLGNSPLSNSFLSLEELNAPEVYYPLKLFVCEACFLVQIDEYRKSEDIFNAGYVYFSSFSSSWLKHAQNYVAMITDRLGLTRRSSVVEIASNDGYLLQYFKARGIPCLGIEPAESAAKVAREKGLEVVSDFFGVKLAGRLVQEGQRADLVIGNNVLAHVPNINDFVKGLKILLKEDGVITLEFPHLLRLIEQSQFDTIYHEHFSYLSFHTVERIFAAHGLSVFDVEELPTHGGSLRIYARHQDAEAEAIAPRVQSLREQEYAAGMGDLSYYRGFQDKANKVKYDLLTFLLDRRRQGEKVVAYGAAAKGNTLLNYCGIREDLVSFVVDASPHKHGKFLPGSHIPVVRAIELKEHKPNYVIILPWNLEEEIREQLHYIRSWDGKFVIPIPRLTIQ
ncbi:MAG: class I SAM-dependent methyltransferase [Desulfobacterales bacterium]|nr:MAG: class I SAM-dependent methyltransferase [Desulfobacterales bacterium]